MIWSTYPRVLCTKGCFENIRRFTRWSLLFNSCCRLCFRSAILLKKRLRYSCFVVNFAKFFRTTFYVTPLNGSYCICVRSINNVAAKHLESPCHNFRIVMTLRNLLSLSLGEEVVVLKGYFFDFYISRIRFKRIHPNWFHITQNFLLRRDLKDSPENLES